jgi:hypothetical protein
VYIIITAAAAITRSHIKVILYIGNRIPKYLSGEDKVAFELQALLGHKFE